MKFRVERNEKPHYPSSRWCATVIGYSLAIRRHGATPYKAKQKCKEEVKRLRKLKQIERTK